MVMKKIDVLPTTHPVVILGIQLSMTVHHNWELWMVLEEPKNQTAATGHGTRILSHGEQPLNSSIST